MKKYKIVVVQSLAQVIEVEAKDKTDAILTVEEMYLNDEINFDESQPTVHFEEVNDFLEG